MKKGKFVEYVQHNLSAGLVTGDTKKKFPDQVVEMAIELVVQDLVSSQNVNGVTRNLIAPKSSFVQVQTQSSRKFLELPYEPSSGVDSVLLIAPDFQSSPYTIHRNVPMFNMYSELQGENMGNGVYLEDNKYFFIKNPLLEEVYVSMLPSFSEYEDDDDLVMGNNHLFVYQKVIEMLQVNIGRVEDKLNNAKTDERNAG